MIRHKLDNDRFIPEGGLRITVQVPDIHVQRVADAVLAKDTLRYGDYDSVMYRTTTGTQQFRSLGSGRNAATAEAVELPCVELSFFLADDETDTVQVLKAIYESHPYEEPVVFVDPCFRTLHIRGLDEDNPNRFWNGPAEDWVPKEHQ
ncbi:hypothetical protein [Phaeobacter sp. JH20_39]|uniref:hypothetical protein n=1 Tax=Phaeobacter sp. JH20_39 TaxID=3112496 RepID=UPI003A87115C